MWDENFEYTGNKVLEGNRDSSGSLPIDLLSYLVQGGLLLDKNNAPAKNYLDINYIGDGLARSSIRPMENYSYKNPYLLGELMRASTRKNMYGNNTGGFGNKDMFANAKKSDDISTFNMINPSLPSSIYDNTFGGNTIDNFKTTAFEYPTYGNGGTFGNYSSKVSDYLGGM